MLKNVRRLLSDVGRFIQGFLRNHYELRSVLKLRSENMALSLPSFSYLERRGFLQDAQISITDSLKLS